MRSVSRPVSLPAGLRRRASMMAAVVAVSLAAVPAQPALAKPADTPAGKSAHGPAAGATAKNSRGGRAADLSRATGSGNGREHARGRGHGRSGKPDGAYDAGTRSERDRAAAERSVALAATWQIDPDLLVPRATDSLSTITARRKLARLNDHFTAVMARYDEAQQTATAAEAAAEAARSALTVAQASADAAAAQYETDHDALVAIVTGTYETGSVGALNLVVSAESGHDFLTGMTLLQQVGQTQSEAVAAAAASATRLEAATVAVAEADAAAQDQLTAAAAALADAEAVRDEVLADVTRARLLLEDKVLADELAAARMYGRAASEAARAFVDTGAKVSFPLPTGAVFVDQHNWGGRSAHWASVHTGDDFSAACGTPVLAATAGTVTVHTDQSWSGPWLVTVSTGEGQLSTWYAHMAALAVADGQKVKAGQPLGVVGTEGNSTGCHLHFEVHPTGGSIYEDHSDPVAWLTGAGVYPKGR